MTNQNYLHFLSLLNKENQEKKWIKYVAIGCACGALIGIYYYTKAQNRKTLIDKLTIKAYLTNAKLKHEEMKHTTTLEELSYSKLEKSRLEYENALLLNKLKSPEKNSTPKE